MTDPVVLAMPERLVDSAWLGHIPFGMWLVHAHRPNVTVELGVHNGASHCAMAQASKAIRHVGHFYGVDHWIGDAHAGTHAPEVYEDLVAFHDLRLRDCSTLMRMSFDEAAEQFSPESVDLLHIDGLHTYEAVRHDFETWLPNMSSRGIILFHDTMVRDSGFGVWQLWEELACRYPSFQFTNSYGLGVLYVGSEPPASWMNSLFDNKECSKDEAIRGYFTRLGEGIVAHHHLAKERATMAQLRVEISEMHQTVQSAAQTWQAKNADALLAEAKAQGLSFEIAAYIRALAVMDPAAITSNEVERAYILVLGRRADAAGLVWWQEQIAQGPVSAERLVSDLCLSTEYATLRTE